MNRQYIQYFLMVLVSLMAACVKEPTSQEHVTRAREYLDAGEYLSAQIELKNATLKDPTNAEARYELAAVAMTLGDAAGAEASARRAVELGIPPQDAALLIVRSSYMQQAYDRVLAETEKFPPELDDLVSADLLGYRALALLQQQKYRSADAVLEIALGLAEDSVIALLAKASYEAQVGRLETAMELASRAVEIDPDSAEGWALLGELFAVRGNLTEAKEAYDKAVAKRAYVSTLFARRAYISAQMGDFAAADADINKLLDSGFQKVPYVNFVKGYTEFRKGNYAEAAAALQLALSATPEDPLSKFYYVASLMEQGKSDQDKLDQAQMAANQLYNDIPDSVEVARMLASIDVQKEDFGAAEERLRALLAQNENDTVALGMLGSIALVQGDGEKAAEYFERLLALTPDATDVKRLLIRARTMRGDFVSELSSKVERYVSPEEFDQVLTTAAVALQQGQLSEALIIAQNLQEQFPDNVEPVKMIATIYIAAGDWRTGKSLLEDVLSMEPLEPSATKALAKIYLRTGEEARAEQLISSYLQEHPNDQDANGLLSQIIVATKDYAQSEAMLSELAKKNPENLEVSARLTKLYFDEGNYERVLSRTENLSEEDITSQPSLIELRGKSLIKLGDYGRAAEVWERWVEISPDYVLANYYHADALARSGEMERALEFLEKSHKLNPDYIPARIALIRMYALSGDVETAFVEMKKLQSGLTRERADVWYTQGWLNALAGKHSDAVQALNKSMSIEETPQAAMLLFAGLNTLGRPDEALASLESWREKFPDNVGIMTLLGETYLGRDDYDKAVAIYRQILTVDPVSIQTLNNLAWLTRDADLSKAIDYAKRASLAAPDAPVVLDTLGVLLGMDGQDAEAEAYLRRAVDLQPDNLQFKLNLGRQLLKRGDTGDAQKVLGEVVEKSDSEALVLEASALLESLNSLE